VTVGVIWATIASTNVENKVDIKRWALSYVVSATANWGRYLKKQTTSSPSFALGITILSIAMILSAGLGLLQEVTYRKYGKAWREGLFYTVSKPSPLGST
jgi:hypothetical protein